MSLRGRLQIWVPGHGTRCELARDRRGDIYPRPTERRMAIRYEQTASGSQ